MRLVIALTLVTLAVISVALARLQTNVETKLTVDPEQYAYVMSYEVKDVYDFEQYFVSHQYSFLPIAPPAPGFSLLQGGVPGILPFDQNAFPKEFVARLTGYFENSVPVYPVIVIEDPKTRDAVFFNSDGKEIYSLPPVPNYDPFAFLKDTYAWLYAADASADQRDFWQGVFDPARIQLVTKLISSSDVEPYLYAQAAVDAAAKPANLAQRAFLGGGGGPMGPSGGGNCTSFQFSAISKTSTGIVVTLCCPSSVTNVDIFTTTNIPPFWWRLDGSNLPSPGDNISWTITTPDVTNAAISVGAADANYDNDGDGLTDGREFFLFHTATNDVDTDDDGLVDGMSGVVGTNAYPSGIHTGGSAYVEGEISWGTDPLNPDTDGDGLSDGSEISQGFNPTNGNDPPSISGLLSYSGRQTGYIYVVAVATSNSWSTNCSVRLTNAGNYQIIKACLTNYFLQAWRDTDGDLNTNATEAFVIYTNNPIVVTGKLTNINLVITDPDVDADSLPDWWENAFFGSTTNWGMTNDPDADQYSNLEEYLADYSPTNSASHPHNIEGSIGYEGPQTGRFVVIASTSDTWTVSGSQTLSTTGAYAITHQVTNIQYWVKAYRDSNGNTNNDFFEAWGVSVLNPVVLTNNLTNINVTLTNPDTDGDSIPDYWEIQYGFDPSNGGGSATVGWWKMDETSGTNVLDSSGYTNSGYLSSTSLASSSWTIGVISNGLGFNGTNAYVQLTDSSSLKPDHVGVMLWIKPGQSYSNGSAVFFTKRNPTNASGYELSYTNGYLTFIVYAPTAKAVSVSATLASNAWLHVAGTYDGEHQRLYTNGGLATSTTWDNGIPPPVGGISISHSTVNPRIGASTDLVATNYFLGRMDDVRVYSSDLAGNEIAAISEVGKDGEGDGLSTWQEYQAGTYPNDSDSDDDGLPDGIDAYPTVYDTNSPTFTITYPTNNMAVP